jgi:hypothetical protein
VRCLLEKIISAGDPLLSLPAEMNRGSSTGADEAYMVEAENSGLEPEVLRIPVFAEDFSRFEIKPKSNTRIIFPYECRGDNYVLIREPDFKRKYPVAYDHLKSHRRILDSRAAYKEWYAFSAPRSLAQHDNASILVPLLANRGLGALILGSQAGTLCPMASGGFTISLAGGCTYHPAYVLGLLNSKALFWVLQQWSNIFRGGWVTCTKQYFGRLPIKRLNLKIPKEKAAHDEIVGLVQTLVQARVKLREARIERDQLYWARKIDGTENDLEDRIAGLYGLTIQERKLFTGESEARC